MPAEWQIALAGGAGFLIGVLCTYLACCLAAGSAPPRPGPGRDEHCEEGVGADAEGPAGGAPQGRPQ